MPDFERIVLPEQRADRTQSWTHLAIFGGLSLLAIAVLVNVVVADPTTKRFQSLWLPVLGILALILYAARPLLARVRYEIWLDPEWIVAQRHDWPRFHWGPTEVAVPLAGVGHCSWDPLEVWLETATGNRIVLARGYSIAVHETLYQRIVEHLEFFTRIGFAQHAAQTSWTARPAPVPHPRWPIYSDAERMRVRFPLEVPHPVAVCLSTRRAWMWTLYCGVGVALTGLVGLFLVGVFEEARLSLMPLFPLMLLILGIPMVGEARRAVARSDLRAAILTAARLTTELEVVAEHLHRTDANGQVETWPAESVRDLEVVYHQGPVGKADKGHWLTLLLHPQEGLPQVLFTTGWVGDRYDRDLVHAELSWLAHAFLQHLHEGPPVSTTEQIQARLPTPSPAVRKKSPETEPSDP